MDVGILHGLGTVMIIAVFIDPVIWAYSGKHKKSLDEATTLSFADDPKTKRRIEQAPRNNEK